MGKLPVDSLNSLSESVSGKGGPPQLKQLEIIIANLGRLSANTVNVKHCKKNKIPVIIFRVFMVKCLYYSYFFNFMVSLINDKAEFVTRLFRISRKERQSVL